MTHVFLQQHCMYIFSCSPPSALCRTQCPLRLNFWWRHVITTIGEKIVAISGFPHNSKCEISGAAFWSDSPHSRTLCAWLSRSKHQQTHEIRGRIEQKTISLPCKEAWCESARVWKTHASCGPRQCAKILFDWRIVKFPASRSPPRMMFPFKRR